MRRLLLLLGTAFLFTVTGSISTAQVPVPTSPPGTLINTNQYIRAARLGITHISSVDERTSPERYRNALLLGAGWNRWPLYWDRVERAPGEFDWLAYDQLVVDDMAQNLDINAIFLGRPEFYGSGKSIRGLDESIFADGSDRPGSGKRLNPDNPWANFVFQAVLRYKPGGLLAQGRGWPPGRGISVWEAWNEPDFEPFWQGSVADYARLLKVTYIVTKLADPAARVMFGGLLFSGDDNWLAQALAIYSGDPLAAENNYYMDMVAIHSYSYPWRSGWLTHWAKQTLKEFGLDRPVWVNESGVPVWDDYPGPVWANNPTERRLRATVEQQAWFFVQSTAYAWAEGAEVVFFHQLYDDCGNQPAGTDFPPHGGELCIGGGQCLGDAHGLFRNGPESACFRQHPFGGTPRPAALAFRLMADAFGAEPFGNPAILDLDDSATVIAFDRLRTNERLYVIWNRTFERVVLDIPASADRAQLYGLDNDWKLVPNDDGLYQIGLEPAIPDDYPYLRAGDVTAIGGPPLILVEGQGEFSPNLTLAQINTPDLFSAPRVPLALTPGSVLPPPPRPTTDPSLDTRPPNATIASLPEISPATFTVTWSGEDNSGIDRYLVWVRVNGGDWQPWVETTRTEAEYGGESGSTYEFAVWAVDLADNWSQNIDLTAQATTRVE